VLGRCGIDPPAGLTLDGDDIGPTLAGDSSSPRTEMFWQRRSDRAARVGHWKWVESARGGGLFDLSNDIGEQHDLSVSHPDKLEELTAAFQHWRTEMDHAEPRRPFRDF